MAMKGPVVQLWTQPVGQLPAGQWVTSDDYVDCTDFDSLSVRCYLNVPVQPVAFQVVEADAPNGRYLPVADPAGYQVVQTSTPLVFRCAVDRAYARLQLQYLTPDISISPPAGQVPSANADAAALVSGLAALPPQATRGKIRDLAATVQSLQDAPGLLTGLSILNSSAAAAYVQLFDALRKNVTPGTTHPDWEWLVGAGAMVECRIPAGGIPFAISPALISATAEGGGTGSAAGVEVFYTFLPATLAED